MKFIFDLTIDERSFIGVRQGRTLQQMRSQDRRAHYCWENAGFYPAAQLHDHRIQRRHRKPDCNRIIDRNDHTLILNGVIRRKWSIDNLVKLGLRPVLILFCLPVQMRTVIHSLPITSSFPSSTITTKIHTNQLHWRAG